MGKVSIDFEICLNMADTIIITQMYWHTDNTHMLCFHSKYGMALDELQVIFEI